MVGAHGEFTQSTQLIRILLKKRLHELKYEDKDYLNIILKTKDGIKNIPDEDLQELCRDRGMRSAGLTRTRLEIQYSDWLELSADPKISVSKNCDHMSIIFLWYFATVVCLYKDTLYKDALFCRKFARGSIRTHFFFLKFAPSVLGRES